MSGPLPVILIILVIIGAGLYFVTSGLPAKTGNMFSALFSHSSSTGGSFSSTSSGTYHGPQGPASLPKTQIAPPTQYGNTSGGYGQPAVSPQNIPKGFTAAQLSPFFGEVRLQGVSGGANGQISLSASLNPGERVDVTGWEIKANNGGEYVPQAVVVYDPLGLAAPTDIVLGAQDIVNIYPRSAPVNLRLNKCVGYLNPASQFNPPLYSSCPSVNLSEIQTFSGSCQNYIESLGGCRMADLSDPRIPQNDYNCIDYIKRHFTYRACFDAHQTDADFLSREVRVWAGSNPLDPFHDNVLLVDRSGLLVDLYSY